MQPSARTSTHVLGDAVELDYEEALSGVRAEDAMPATAPGDQGASNRVGRPHGRTYGMVGQLAGCAWSVRIDVLGVPEGKR